jgi:large subunit ribosomal protein L3
MAVTGILGKKIGMTQVFDDKGDVHPITVLQAGPCVITQLKTLAKDGYEAAQIGLVEFVKAKNVTKPQAGHFAKTEAPPVKVIGKSLWSSTPMALWLSRPATGCWWTSSPKPGLWT